MPKDGFRTAVVESDSTGHYTPGDVTIWRDGGEVTLSPHELKLAYELALRTKESRDRLLGPVTELPNSRSEWKVGDQCEVWLHSRESWVRGMVADKAARRNEYRVVDPANDRRWATWVKPWEMYPVTEKDALLTERDKLRERVATVERERTAWRLACLAAEQERDRLRVRVSELELMTDAPSVSTEMDRLLGRILDVQTEAVRAADERDRLRRELEGLRERFISDVAKHPWSAKDVDHLRGWVREQLDTILAGPTTQPPTPPPHDPKLDERARALYVHCTGDRHNLHTLGWHELSEERKDVWRSKVRGGEL